ncbi:unnamed protein product [Prorocentrum cordatum]|uniref:Uncharacterized protein n=1 Tax=Prorocentrum cordatum TaxID=2364126 RepID=A0ABN9U443_9DINO|nr:unnamed protein product [Polarella glacialis]
MGFRRGGAMFRSRVPEPMPRTPSVAATATPSPPPSALGAAEEAPGPAHSNKEIDGAVRAAVAQVLGSHPFAVDLVDEWCNQILEHSIKQGNRDVALSHRERDEEDGFGEYDAEHAQLPAGGDPSSTSARALYRGSPTRRSTLLPRP